MADPVLCKGLLAKVDVDAKLQQVKTQTFSEFKSKFYFPRLLQFYTAYRVKEMVKSGDHLEEGQNICKVQNVSNYL